METIYNNNSKLISLRDKCIHFIDKYNLLCLFVVFAAFIFSRLFHLDINPSGIHYDEAGMAFDAKTLAMYGTDRHNNSFPFYLPAYGGGQSALYAYSLALLLKFVPFSLFVMRLPAVLWASLAFFSSYLLVRDMFDDRKWALMGPILVTITPYFMASERWALDCNLFLSVATFSFNMFVRAHLKGRVRDYVFAGLALGLTLYTYVLSYIVLPIFVVLSVVYVLVIMRERLHEFPFVKYIAMGIPTIIMGMPLLLMQLINMGKIKPFHFLLFDFPRLGFYRGQEMSLSAIPHNISKLWMMLFRGDQYSFICVPCSGPVYKVMIPLIVGGFVIAVVRTVRSVREQAFTPEAFILIFTVAGYVPVLIIDAPLNIYTGNELYIMYVLYAIICMRWIAQLPTFINNRDNDGIIKHGVARVIEEHIWVAIPVILVALAVSFLMFSNYYFRHYNEEYGIQFMFVSMEYGDVPVYVNEHCNPEHKKVFYDRSPQHQSYGEVIVGMAMGADSNTWESDYLEKNMVDNVYLGLPDEEISLERDDCVYIFSRETHGHIWPYFAEAGWNIDDTFDSYVIAYR